MNTGLIGARYAAALFAFAKQNKADSKVYAEVKNLSENFYHFSQLKIALDNPIMLIAEKKKLILMATGENVSHTFKRFTDLLLENNRENQLQTIVLKYIDLYREYHNIHVGKLSTAATTDEITEKRMIAMVRNETGGTLEIEKEINPDLLGGFTFEVDFKKWDASISGQLNRIRREYIDKNQNII